MTFMRNNQAGADLENDDAAQLIVSAIAYPIRSTRIPKV